MSAIDIVCLGDLMFECIVQDASWPRPNSTLIVDSHGQELGGAAFNTCWNLAHLGRPPRLVSPFGRRQALLVRETLAAAGLPVDGMMEAEGDTDLLLVFVRGNVFRSVYLRGLLPDRLVHEIHERVNNSRCLILVGSRHPALRDISLGLAQNFHGEFLVFSPSYAIYEYPESELEPLIRQANITVMNRSEAEYMCRTLGMTSIEHLARSLPGIAIVTLAHQGARVFEDGHVLEFGSYAHSTVDALGAGDAFLAGFLFEKLRGVDTTPAARFASMCGAHVAETAQVRIALTEATIRRRLLECSGR